MSISTTVGGFYPDYPTRCFEAQVDVEGAKLSSPTFAADGSRLFWADSADGVHTAAPGTQAPGATVTTAKLAAVLRKGLVLRVTGAAGGRHTLVAKYGKATVAKGTVKVSSTGAGKATLRFTTAGKRKLAKRKRVTLNITGRGRAPRRDAQALARAGGRR